MSICFERKNVPCVNDLLEFWYVYERSKSHYTVSVCVLYGRRFGEMIRVKFSTLWMWNLGIKLH